MFVVIVYSGSKQSLLSTNSDVCGCMPYLVVEAVLTLCWVIHVYRHKFFVYGCRKAFVVEHLPLAWLWKACNCTYGVDHSILDGNTDNTPFVIRDVFVLDVRVTRLCFSLFSVSKSQ